MTALAVFHDKGLLKSESEEYETVVKLKKEGKLKPLPRLGGGDGIRYQLVP